VAGAERLESLLGAAGDSTALDPRQRLVLLSVLIPTAIEETHLLPQGIR
jgi:hypothetical protein